VNSSNPILGRRAADRSGARKGGKRKRIDGMSSETAEKRAFKPSISGGRPNRKESKPGGGRRGGRYLNKRELGGRGTHRDRSQVRGDPTRK